MSRVSVCCAYYNRADSIRGTLDSLLAQTHDDLEIIVINDGSKDPRVAEILSFYSDPRLRVIHQENQGFVPTIRRAVQEATGEYVAIQGAGDLSLPERIARQAALLDDQPNVGIVSCRQREMRIGGPRAGEAGLSRLISLTPDGPTMAGRFAPIIHGEVMFRKALYDKVGGYRPIFTYAQDRDLWLRIVEHAEIRVIDEILYQRNHFFEDGVNANPEKVVQQRTLALFAVQCYHDRQKYGRDLIQRYGHVGPFYRQRHAELAGFIARRSKENFFAGNDDIAARLADLALEEAWTRESVIIGNAVKYGVKWKSIGNIIKTMASSKKRAKQLIRPSGVK